MWVTICRVWKFAVCKKLFVQTILWVKVCCVYKFSVDKNFPISVKNICVQTSLCKSLLCVNASLCQTFSVESVGVACFGAEIGFWSRFSARGERRWFESALRRAVIWDVTSWQDLGSAEEVWEELGRCEKRKEEMRRRKMRAEKSWEELWKPEESWEELRWKEMRQAQMTWE